ncbi:unnamed protein product [Rotaria socialis]|uniref:Uncharacterized protein n=1 Tax=Rotaria socialis TaxID=392032 RepID=A0A821Q1I2_9BILA|nr:unnamed protein product [Rotaria socialis]CAF3296589.1 unnamed protein product [Rotaria socialis]CAF3328092.1 unnamed protein product [Rotaria socialis]CAF3411587.1 unnamed protein product [Rotaria socialis]CAF4167139.1 unnamed protein product [Rotaria socialis]
MLIEKATNPQTLVQLMPYSGIVNPEHVNQMNCIPMVSPDDGENSDHDQLESVYIDDFTKKSQDFQNKEMTNSLPIEIRLGTVYTYQNSEQRTQYPNSLSNRLLSVQSLRNEEHRPRNEKDFFITFNKNKGVNDIEMFENELICAGFRATNDEQTTHRLYLRHHQKRLILELTRDADDPSYFSVKRLLKYSSKYTHIDVVRSKDNSNYSDTYDDIFDIRTSIGKAEEEELHINDDYCNFIRIKNLNQCVCEKQTQSGQKIYQFNRNLLRYFDFFQIKQTIVYDYACINSRFFGVRVLIEHQIGYDLCTNSRTQTPCLKTNNVVMAKLVSSEFSEAEAKRIWMIGTWLSDLATRCTRSDLPCSKIFCRQPSQTPTCRRVVRSTL